LFALICTPIDNATKEARPIPGHFKQSSVGVMIGQWRCRRSCI